MVVGLLGWLIVVFGIIIWLLGWWAQLGCVFFGDCVCCYVGFGLVFELVFWFGIWIDIGLCFVWFVG